ncbi:uncharacterized protein [Hyperolius riggenbachi]|uniref:uncharacterized protein isoform X2 n=1 Tax=Hyperolius riggenbachi TaxID=752182 RepID=UPI0035A3AF70
MMENQPALTSRDGSSNRNPPESCTGPLYSQDSTQDYPTTPHHYQCEEWIGLKCEVKEEEETYVRSDQQSMEEGDMMRTSKEEEETYVRSDQQSMEEGDMMRTSKEEEETYVRSDQQSMEEGDMMRTSKEEEETYVRSDQQSMEEGDMMRTSKEEEETYVRSDQQSMEEGDMMRTSKEEEETYVRSDQQSMEEGDMMTNIEAERSSVEMFTGGDKEASGGSYPVITTIPLGVHTAGRANDWSNSQDSSSTADTVTGVAAYKRIQGRHYGASTSTHVTRWIQ